MSHTIPVCSGGTKVMFLMLLLLLINSCQARSFDHWQVDLYHRMASYRYEHDELKRLISDAIQQETNNRIILNDLLVDRQIFIDNAAVKMLNSSRAYLNHVNHQLIELDHQHHEVMKKLNVPNKYVFKNNNNNTAGPLRGAKRFSAPIHIHSIDAPVIHSDKINKMDINPSLKRIFKSEYDRKNRLYIEGVKVFERSAFDRSLRSGCCNRLFPISMNKVMTTSGNQSLTLAVLRAPSRILNLFTNLIKNEGNINTITTSNLVFTGSMNTNNVLWKDFIFNQRINIYNLTSANNIEVINHYGPPKWLSLDHRNLMNDVIGSPQRILQPVVMIGSSSFANLNSLLVNGQDLAKFLETIVRLDKPTNINSRIVVGSSMVIENQLSMDKLNGLSIPDDIIVQQLMTANVSLVVRQPKIFSRWPQFNIVESYGPVSSILLPKEVITVLNDDPIITTSEPCSLLFSNGITSMTITLSSDNRNFDRLDLDQSVDSAASLITKSSFVNSLNGMRLLKSQLTVNELFLRGNDNKQGLLNGLRIEDLLVHNESLPIMGRISFAAIVEVAECSFSSINHVANWRNNMIGLTEVPQQVNTHLIFENPYNTLNVQHLNIDLTNQYVQHGSPEFATLNRILYEQSMMPGQLRVNSYRAGNQLIMVNPMNSTINGINLANILTKHSSGPVSGKVTFVGRIGIAKDLRANIVYTKEPLNGIDIVQFDMYRIRLHNSDQFVPNRAQYPYNGFNDRELLKFNNLLLDNSQIQGDIEANSINSVSLQEFFNSIMSVSRNQLISGPKRFFGDVVFSNFVQPNLVNGFRLSDIGRNAVKVAGHGHWESHFNDMVFQDGLTVISAQISNQSTIISDGKATSYPELKSMQFRMRHNLIDKIIVKGNLLSSSITVHHAY